MPAEMFNWDKAENVGRSDDAITEALDRVVKRYAVEAAENAKLHCPVLTGTLQKSLTASVDYKNRVYPAVTGQKIDKLTYLVGSALPYTAKQEFEHKTKSHFIHKGIKSVKEPMKKEAANLLTKILGDFWKKGVM